MFVEEAVVPYCCGTARVADYVQGGRLCWSVRHDCAGGSREVACGYERLPDDWRQAVLEQCGTFRLRFPDDLGAGRVAVLRVLRRHGFAMGELRAVLDSGVSGTRAELTLLADRCGAAVWIGRE
ncbi:hypothetical protein BJY16_006045 [Actinoplanes octamycinicus]|uniref:Uncharacterized protein n=1 Tax=Actinoplanes octamycinicus TaxID=135948 RepID=A0A7W7H240_9ACTN|nr:hypothetical protein [Actinoplanes octamycinicus]MBB4742586.1 hypothetical protein [Actinoplanes octamycinicus]